MDPWDDTSTVLTFATWTLALILQVNEAALPSLDGEAEESDLPQLMDFSLDDGPLLDTLLFCSNSVHHQRLCLPSGLFSDDVEFWVRPRSTTWFSRFLLQQYDNARWVSMFRMTKASVFHLAELLRPEIEKKNTKYRLAIPVLVRVACTLFKLAHGISFAVCSEFFAIGRSTVCKVLREVVHAINDTLRHELSWPLGDRCVQTQLKFQSICSLPAVVGAIDGTHISIAKPHVGAADYFYFKTGGYSMNCQAVVDADKRFIDLYVGMPGSTNDSRMLRRSSLYSLALEGQLLNSNDTVEGYPPFLIGDSGYPLLPWLMVPHREGRRLSIAETTYNRKLKRGRVLVENAFGILKHTFRELLLKSVLSVTFLPDVVFCCCILHNILLQQSHADVEQLLEILQREAVATPEDAQSTGGASSSGQAAPAESDWNRGRAVHNSEEVRTEWTTSGLANSRRRDLGLYLTNRRGLD